MYMNGRGVPQDDVTACEWYRKAADQGQANAQGSLGYGYMNGCGVPQDFVAAAQWLQKAADQGDARSKANLGVMYRDGFGVAQDFVTAHEWFQKAIAHGFTDAEATLKDLEQRMTSEQIMEATRRAREDTDDVRIVDKRRWTPVGNTN